MRLPFPLEVILMRVRGHVAYQLSLRHLEEMLDKGAVVRKRRHLKSVTKKEGNLFANSNSIVF